MKLGWLPSNDQLAQTSHFFIATTLVLGMPFLFGISPWWGALAVVCWVIPKDFFFDLVVEQAGVKSGIWDASWYGVGAAVALALCWWFVKF
jgi:hypothetical protein